MNKRTFLVLSLVILGACLWGCGKKAWPEPEEGAQRFSWETVYGAREESCLVITARLSGNMDNLRDIILELAETATDTDCPGCPFHPREKVRYELSDPSIEIKGKRIILRHCGLDEDAIYRFRLVGNNVHDAFAPESSAVVFSEP